jgi:hypothetical protein
MKTFVYTFALLVAVVSMTSCATKKNGVKTETQEAIQTNQSTSTAVKVDKTDTLFASLDRGYCFGTCPVFTLKIYQSGYAEFEGKANIEMIGVFHATFSQSQMDELVEVAKRINYMSFEDTYDNPRVTDLPSHTSSIVIDNRRKQVTRRINYPESIVVFEKKMEELMKDLKWQQLAK